MLNTLANHGYLPRNGRDISKEMAIEVLDQVLNWDVTVVSDLYDFAQPTNPEPNATTINLKELTTHNILEHDASLRYVLPNIHIKFILDLTCFFL
jgi:hypothetical protein